MAETKENKYRVIGFCPKCNNLIDVNLTLTTTSLDEQRAELLHKKNIQENVKSDGKQVSRGKSENIRPNSPKGDTAKTGTTTKPVDSTTSAKNSEVGGGIAA